MRVQLLFTLFKSDCFRLVYASIIFAVVRESWDPYFFFAALLSLSRPTALDARSHALVISAATTGLSGCGATLFLAANAFVLADRDVFAARDLFLVDGRAVFFLGASLSD